MTSPVPIENDLDHVRNKKVARKIVRLLRDEFRQNLLAAVATSRLASEVLTEVIIEEYGQKEYDRIFK